MKPWRRKIMCDTCPFQETGPGRELRDSLRRGLFAGIKHGLLNGEVFFCHKHTDHDQDDEDGYTPKQQDRVCAGAIAFQEQHNCVSQYVQVCSRLEQTRARNRKDLSCD